MLTLTHVWLCAIVLYTASAQSDYLNLTEGQPCDIEGSRISICKFIKECPKTTEDSIKYGKSPVICNWDAEHPVVCCETDEPGIKSKQSDVCGGDGSTCKSILDCPKAKHDLMMTGKPLKVCSFTGDHPIVCCEPEENLQPPGTKCKEMCKEYADSVFSKQPNPLGEGFFYIDLCATGVNPLMTGGTNSAPKEFPHMALIGFGSSNDKQWGCGGSLISERFVLSAAHCSRLNKWKKT